MMTIEKANRGYTMQDSDSKNHLRELRELREVNEDQAAIIRQLKSDTQLRLIERVAEVCAVWAGMPKTKDIDAYHADEQYLQQIYDICVGKADVDNTHGLTDIGEELDMLCKRVERLEASKARM